MKVKRCEGEERSCLSCRAASSDQERQRLERFERKPECDDPKDGELLLMRLKSRETSMEDRKGADVQIALHN